MKTIKDVLIPVDINSGRYFVIISEHNMHAYSGSHVGDCWRGEKVPFTHIIRLIFSWVFN